MLLARQIKQSGADINVIATPVQLRRPSVATRLVQGAGGEWNRSQFWVTNYATAVQGYLDAKLPKSFSKALARSSGRPSIERFVRRQPSLKSDYRVDWCTSFDDRFDGMWEELKNSVRTYYSELETRRR